jgi:glutamine cyclotransferase
MKNKAIIVLAIVTILCLSISAFDLLARNGDGGKVPTYTYAVVAAYPHDPKAFTEGLVYYNGSLYESTGLYGQSSLREVDLETGNVTKIIQLPNSIFGEGITIFNDEIIQLTWQSHIGFVYNLGNFSLQRTFTYYGEGWGLTTDGVHLIMSNGTSILTLLDPNTFQTEGYINVHDDEGQVTQLNELEYVNGLIYANVWGSNSIAQISPETGQIVGWIDLTGLLSQSPIKPTQPVDVLNGIAYDSANNRLFVTGKLWPAIFQIQLELEK